MKSNVDYGTLIDYIIPGYKAVTFEESSLTRLDLFLYVELSCEYTGVIRERNAIFPTNGHGLMSTLVKPVRIFGRSAFEIQ